ncbi:MAG: virginiamycin B lyase family protein [Gammaproteobacteria bacterium]
MRSMLTAALAILLAWNPAPADAEFESRSYVLPDGAGPHDVAPSPEPGGVVWYTAQTAGALGRLDPNTGAVKHIALGEGSAPHGVIVGPDGAPWITDGGLNAIVRVDPQTLGVKRFPLPEQTDYANLNTATFDNRGVLWFTGQEGIYGRFNPESGEIQVYQASQGYGPYGITTTPDGDVYYASLAGSHIAKINTATGEAKVIEPPTAEQGARRVWSDSRGRIWVSEWNSGQVSVYEPATQNWRSWRLPGERPQAYAVYVDNEDIVWLSDFGANAVVRFDPDTQEFDAFPSPREDASVRQILGRDGEIWLPESGTDRLVVLKTR